MSPHVSLFRSLFNGWTSAPSVFSGDPAFVLMHGNSNAGQDTESSWAPAPSSAPPFPTTPEL